MLINPKVGRDVDKLANRLAGTTSASAPLFAEVFAASPRLVTLKSMGKTVRLDRLLTCEAWTEAALELIALDAPNWSVQRLILDDREWLCTLTRYPDVPHWLDDSTEGRHPVLALAILAALLDFRAQTAITSAPVLRQLAGFSIDCADYR